MIAPAFAWRHALTGTIDKFSAFRTGTRVQRLVGELGARNSIANAADGIFSGVANGGGADAGSWNVPLSMARQPTITMAIPIQPQCPSRLVAQSASSMPTSRNGTVAGEPSGCTRKKTRTGLDGSGSHFRMRT